MTLRRVVAAILLGKVGLLELVGLDRERQHRDDDEGQMKATPKNTSASTI